MKRKRKIIEGNIYGDYLCLKQIRYKINKTYIYKYLMKCTKCGREKEMLASTILLKKGITHKSCGQGLKLKDKKFYSIWLGIRTRTTNKNASNSKWYIDKNISSDDWKYFIDFYDDMYELYLKALEKYDTPSIERLDYNKDYCKENCTFIELNEQQMNTSRTIRGFAYYNNNEYEFVSLRRFAHQHNLNYSCCSDVINGRLKQYKGWTFKRKM